MTAGTISFVGAGPGAADLITLRGAARLGGADIVIWASSLVPEELLGHARPEAVVHDSKTMTLEDVLAVYGANPEAAIVRLHSGDPALYGAVQEQVDWCQAQDRPYEVVPGVSSLAAAAALVGRELTIPTVSQSVVITRLANRTSASMPPGETIAAYAATGCTLAVFLSAAHPEDLQGELLGPTSAYGPDTPAAIVIRASWPDERMVLTTVGELAGAMRTSGATLTVLVLVGDFLRSEGETPRSHLYSPGFAHTFRKRSTPGTTEGRPAGGRLARAARARKR